MTTLAFPKPDQHCMSSSTTNNPQAQKKDLATFLSNHVHSNPSTTVTLSDPSGKTVSIESNTGDPVQLLGLAIGYLSH